MDKKLVTNEENEISQRIAQKAGENIQSYTSLSTLTIYNPSNDGKESEFKIGDFIKSTKTAQGYTNEKYKKPFDGIILKVRMFLRLKYKYAEGKPNILTNEFNSYNDTELISVKEQDAEGKYQPVFVGNYKEVNNKYSLKDDTEIEKKLELHHAIYVLTDFKTRNIVRIDSKGVSRSNFFDYMNDFTRQDGDFMSTTMTKFSSILSDKTYTGKTRKSPIAAFSFTKKDKLSLKQLQELENIQTEFNAELEKLDEFFGSKLGKKEAPLKEDTPAKEKEEIPIIQIDEEEEEVNIKDIPF